MADAVGAASAAPAAAVHPTPPVGLSSAEVANRRSRGLANTGAEPTSRSLAEILRANILTRFNLILGVLLAVILAVGDQHQAEQGILWLANGQDHRQHHPEDEVEPGQDVRPEDLGE